MIPWKLLDTAQVPGGTTELRLYQRDAEFSIRVDRSELMNSRVYASEDAFSEVGCARIKDRQNANVLVGGLGMGYSLRTALNRLPSSSTVVVAELVAAVVKWNREWLGHLADHPLRDPRVRVRQDDVGRVLRESKAEYDLIMLDVDNGPQGLTRKANDWIYGRAGLLAAREALRPNGVFGVWSSGPDRAFVQRLRHADFVVDEIELRARGKAGGARHTIWLGTPKS